MIYIWTESFKSDIGRRCTCVKEVKISLLCKIISENLNTKGSRFPSGYRPEEIKRIIGNRIRIYGYR